jgi:hypothetical protein
MRYELISADCHIDLCWLPPDLFVGSASAEWRDRMPYVTEGPKGPAWTTKKGASLGLACGMGSAGREYVPGRSPTRSGSYGLTPVRALSPPAHPCFLGEAPEGAVEVPGDRQIGGRRRCHSVACS